MAKPYRTDEEFLEAKRRGEDVELDFINEVTLLGGSAYKIGQLPGRSYSAPKASYLASDGEVAYYNAPDVGFKFPDSPKMIAQIKMKKVYGGLYSKDAHILLDADQLELMNRANEDFGDAVFVVYCEQLKMVPGLHPFSYVFVSDLHPDKVRLHKRKVSGCDVFVLPLTLFRPLPDLLKPYHGIPYDAATPVSPADEGRRKRNVGRCPQHAQRSSPYGGPLSRDASGIVSTEADGTWAEPANAHLKG